MRWLALAAVVMAGCATSQPVTAVNVGPPAIFRAVAEFGPETEVAAYVRLVNGAGADRLVGVSCPCADRVEIHNTDPDGMHVLPHLELPAGATTDIRPGGPTHLMLIGTKQAYRAGDSVQLTFTFANGARVTAAATGVDNSAEGWKAAGD